MDHAVLETDRHRYVVVSALAEGGMGAIYLGRRISARGGDERAADVVLKQLLPEHTADPHLIEMFLREARVSASLEHPNIVRTLDLVNAGDDYYIVMEYVRGGDLRTLLRRARRRQQRFSTEAAVFVATEVLSALSYAHGKRDKKGRPLGIIHRDVSPSNILLGTGGEVKLTDFGIAKAPSQGSVMFKVKGKLGYMAPEQARGESVDVRADLFAVGVVLYEALVGERLFVGTMSSAAGVFSQPIRPPSKRRPEVGSALDDVLMQALALEAGKRFRSADEFRAALLRVAGRPLDATAMAIDLHRACGEDSKRWQALEVPVAATLNDGSDGDGTGVIDTGDDDFDEDRPPTLSRGLALPSRELTSVVLLNARGEAEAHAEPVEELPATRLADDPFARSPDPAQRPSATPQRPPEIAFDATQFAIKQAPQRPFDDDESAAETRVDMGDAIARHREEPVERKPAERKPAERKPVERKPEPAIEAPRPESKRRTGEQAPRATFEAPKPRAVVLPPSDTYDAAPHEPAPTRISRPDAGPPPPPPNVPTGHLPTRVTRSPFEEPRPAPPAPGDASLGGAPSSSMAGTASRPRRVAGPSSLAALERSLSGRPLTKILLAVLLIVVLVALGIGLGIVLSGPGVDMNDTGQPGPSGGARGGHARPATPPAR